MSHKESINGNTSKSMKSVYKLWHYECYKVRIKEKSFLKNIPTLYISQNYKVAPREAHKCHLALYLSITVMMMSQSQFIISLHKTKWRFRKINNVLNFRFVICNSLLGKMDISSTLSSPAPSLDDSRWKLGEEHQVRPVSSSTATPRTYLSAR